MLKEVYNNTDKKHMENTTRRSSVLALMPHMCSSFALHPHYKNHSEWKLNRIHHEKHHVSPQRSRNQLTQGSIRMRCHRDPMSPESTTPHATRISQGTTHSRSQLHPSTFLQVPQYHTLPAAPSAVPPTILSFPIHPCLPSRQST